MRQIDLMVSAKKSEWENHMHAVQIQLDKKAKELEFVKSEMEHKSQEVQDIRFIIILLIYQCLIILMLIFINQSVFTSFKQSNNFFCSLQNRYNVHLTPENSEKLLSIFISINLPYIHLKILGFSPAY